MGDENAELRKLTAELRAERDEARRVAEQKDREWDDLADALNRAWRERNKTRRERDTSQRTMHLALANVAQAASERSRTRLGTVNESVQPVVDAFMGWISDAEADLAALRRRVEEKDAVLHPAACQCATCRVLWACLDSLRRICAAPCDERAVELAEEALATHDDAALVAKRTALASPPVAAQGTREDATQPDAPGREE